MGLTRLRLRKEKSRMIKHRRNRKTRY